MAAKFVLAAASMASVAFGGSQRGKAFLDAVPQIENSLSAAMTNSQGLGPQELKSIEVAIETLVLKGDDEAKVAVAQMSDFIINTLLPNRQSSQKADNQFLAARFTELQQCSLENARNSDMILHNTLSTASDHQESYTKGAADHGDCLSVESGKQLVKAAYCSKVQDAEKVCGCDTAVQDFFGVRPECKAAPAIAMENKQCCDSFAEHKIHEAKCNAAKHDMEYAGRQHEIIMQKVCDDYSGCYASKLKAYVHAEKSVKAKEERREWQSLHLIKCLVDTFKGGKVSEAQVSACKEKKHDIDEIKYPKVPAKETCQVKAA